MGATRQRPANTIGEFLDKLPPQDLEAERCVLGSVLLENNSFDEVQPVVSAACFYSESHRRIFSAISGLLTGKVPVAVDAVTLRDELTRRGELDAVGGTPYLLQLLETVPHAAHAEYYANIVREKWLKRSVIEASTFAMKEAYTGATPAAELLEVVETRLSKLNDIEATDVISLSDSVDEAMEQMFLAIDDPRSLPGVEIPYEEMSNALVKFVPSCLYILAARPSHGKTALSMAIAKHVAASGGNVLVFSLEMTHLELTRRLLAEETGVPTKAILRGQVDGDEQNAIFEASQKIKYYPIRIADSDATVASIRHVSRREKRTHGIDFLIVDYLQHISAPHGSMNREREVAEMSSALKKLAKSLNIPVLCLAQLNRGVEGREDKTPKLADLRDSGSIEQDADAVLMLHVPHKYDDTLPRGRNGVAIITIAKNRHGPTGSVTLNYDETSGRYWSQDEASGSPSEPSRLPYNGW